MTGHTPGPWKIFGIRQENGSITIGDADKGKFLIAEVYNAPSAIDVVFGNPPEVQHANAHLIAAAPEMLSALETIRHQWAGHSEACAAYSVPFDDRPHAPPQPRPKCDCDWPKIAAQCDAAIAKAKGQDR